MNEPANTPAGGEEDDGPKRRFTSLMRILSPPKSARSTNAGPQMSSAPVKKLVKMPVVKIHITAEIDVGTPSGNAHAQRRRDRSSAARVALAHEEDEHRQREAGQADDEEGRAPAPVARDQTADDEPDGAAEDGAELEDAHGAGALAPRGSGR